MSDTQKVKPIDSALRQAVVDIKTAILQGQYAAAKEVNRIQLLVYFSIGKYISANTRNGVWGTGALNTISEQLRRELPGLRGFSETQMKEMRLFYEGWSFLDTNSSVVTDELQLSNYPIDITTAIKIPDAVSFPVEDFFNVPFTHHTRILAAVKDLDARYYYIHRTANEHLPVSRLKAILQEQAHAHPTTAPNNFMQTIPDDEQARRAVMMFKDEYLLNFINVEEIGERDARDTDERVVEQQVIQNIKQFIMTFGHDFSFVGNQYHLEAYGEDMWSDLLFFNRSLNCLVAVELKVGKFKPAYLGQLYMYLQVLDDKVRKPHENPSIGIVLCRDANRSFAEYAVRDYNKPLGVATYRTADEMPEELRKALPPAEELTKLL